ncbi:unnamed protein product, partial [marine sediment metagenome]
MEFLGLTFDGVTGADLHTNNAPVTNIHDKHGRTGQHTIADGILRAVVGAYPALHTLVR